MKRQERSYFRRPVVIVSDCRLPSSATAFYRVENAHLAIGVIGQSSTRAIRTNLSSLLFCLAILPWYATPPKKDCAETRISRAGMELRETPPMNLLSKAGGDCIGLLFVQFHLPLFSRAVPSSSTAFYRPENGHLPISVI